MSTTYHHEPLRLANGTRVLTLQPSADMDEVIAIELTEVDLGASPQYEALSYAWGNVNEKLAISCHGQELLVTTNCHSALRHLRLPDRPRTLWVDAICIDQTSDDDKSKQVRIMGEIYEGAEMVLVWLGPGHQITDLAIGFLSGFARFIDADRETQDAVFLANYRGLMELRGPMGRTIDIFSDLHKRSWFQRVWTLQEIALAKKALVICGKSTISWDTLVWAVDRLRNAENTLGTYDVVSAMDSIVSAHQAVTRAILPRTETVDTLNPNPDRPVTTIVTRTLFKRATEDKDRIFGLYSVLKKTGAELPEPDYRRPVHEIFTEAARLAIEKDNSLWLLDFVNGFTQRPDWPSWVPTWAESLEPAPVEANVFSAAGDSKPDFRFSADGRRLTIRAKAIDEIALKAERSPLKGSPFPLEYSDMDASFAEGIENIVKAYQEWIILWMIFRQMAGNGPMNRYGNESRQGQALVRVLVQDFSIVPNAIEKAIEIMEGFNTWQLYLSATNPGSGMPMPLLEELLRRSPATAEAIAAMPESHRHLAETNEWKIRQAIMQDSESAVFENHVLLGCRGKLFFITGEGFYGLAPASIQTGDEVLLVSGLQFPLIARKLNESQEYQLLGPAFIHGLMGGEVWPAVEGILDDITLV